MEFIILNLYKSESINLCFIHLRVKSTGTLHRVHSEVH